MKPSLKVEGKREVARAFDKVSDDLEDMTRVNQEVANMLLPDVKQGTRVRTGELLQAWEAVSDEMRAQFTNPLQWAVPQEFGTKRGVEPTLAVQGAFENQGDRIDGIYADAIRDSGRSAGLRAK